MISQGGEFLMSQAELAKKASVKWRRVKLLLMTSIAIIFTIPVALLPSALRRVQQTAEFVLLLVSPGLWNSVSTWITAPCLYVLLNIVLVTLVFIYRPPPTSNDDRSHNYGIIIAETEVIETKHDADAEHYQSKLVGPVENDFSPPASPGQVQKPVAALRVEHRSRSFIDLKATLKPASALYAMKSGLRRSTTKLSSLSKRTRESTRAAPKTSPPPQLVVFEISTDHVEDYYTHQAQLHAEDEVGKIVDDEKSNILHREEEGMSLSAEELYVKAESFIGDFYRQLKMQREDSWNRLCGIYKRSC